MTALFPASARTFTTPSTKLGTVSHLHSVMHTELQEELAAVITKLGLSSASAVDTPAAQSALISDAANKSKWLASGSASRVLSVGAGGNIGWNQVTNPMIFPSAVSQGSQVIGSTSTPTTTSTTYVDLTDLSVTLTNVANDTGVLVECGGTFRNSGLANLNYLTINGGSDLAGAERLFQQPVADYRVSLHTFAWFAAPGAGSVTYKGRWKTSAGTLTAEGVNRSIVAIELKV